MKLVSFTLSNAKDVRLGAVRGDRVINLAAASGGRLPSDMLAFLRGGEEAMRLAREVVNGLQPDLPIFQPSSLPAMPLSCHAASVTYGVTLLAPVPNPSKVVAIGLNYLDHCRENHLDPPQSPVIFTKFPSAVVGPGAAIRWDPALTQKVDYEVELAVVIGRAARRVPAEQALAYVAGYTICNDISARDLQFGDGQWVRAKSLDTFCPLGPYLVTADEVPDPHNLRMRCLVNGQVLQDSTTAEMIFGVPELIAFCSRAFTLLPGDVIATGTPHGVGVFRDPPVFLHDGDVVTVEIEGLGELTNPCVEG